MQSKWIPETCSENPRTETVVLAINKEATQQKKIHSAFSKRLVYSYANRCRFNQLMD